MIKNGNFKRHLPLVFVLAVGVAVRAVFVYITRADPPHPDLTSFLPSAVGFSHPFDTSPREPAFVWWLWGLSQIGLSGVLSVRAAGILLFIVNGTLLFFFARRCLGDRWGWVPFLLYTFLAAQIQSDTIGLRHSFETTGVLVLIETIGRDKALSGRSRWIAAATAAAGLSLLRISHLVGAALLLGFSSLRGRSVRPLLALIPAMVAAALHFQNNWARHRDPLFSINLHARWYANLEYIGKPGFDENFEEWQKDPYRPRLNYRQWVWREHRPWEVVRETLVGYQRQLWLFYRKVYFDIGLPSGVNLFLCVCLLGGYLHAFRSESGRANLAGLVLLGYPFAFVGHVFWAGRFFVPFTPLTLVLMADAVRSVVIKSVPAFSPGGALRPFVKNRNFP